VLGIDIAARHFASSVPAPSTPAWHTDPETAVEMILSCTFGVRTPEPLGRARTAARAARASDAQPRR